MTPYYEQDGITIYHGDNREVLPMLASQSVDVVVTSPPYNLGVSTGGGIRNVGASRMWTGRVGKGPWRTGGGGIAKGYADYDDSMLPEQYKQWQQDVLRECWRIIQPAGAIFYNHKPRVQAGVLQTPLDLNPGLTVRQIVVWHRPGGVNFTPAFYLPSQEWIVVFARAAFRLAEGGWNATDVWNMAPPRDVPHPAAFPVALPQRVLVTTGATSVLDPHMGSGTTLRAAKNVGIRGIGIEVSERYCEIAAKGLSQGVLFSEIAADR